MSTSGEADANSHEVIQHEYYHHHREDDYEDDDRDSRKHRRERSNSPYQQSNNSSSNNNSNSNSSNESSIPVVGGGVGSNVRGYKVFLGGLSWETTQEDLARYFGQFGEILDVHVMSTNGKPRGFGFITFAERSVAEKLAQEHHEHTVRGRKVDIKLAIPKEDMNKMASDSNARMFFSGINTSTKEDVVSKYFSQFGRVVDISLLPARGFGFITFADEDSMKKAIRNEEHIVDNQILKVKKAEPKSVGRDRRDPYAKHQRGDRGYYYAHSGYRSSPYDGYDHASSAYGGSVMDYYYPPPRHHHPHHGKSDYGSRQSASMMYGGGGELNPYAYPAPPPPPPPHLSYYSAPYSAPYPNKGDSYGGLPPPPGGYGPVGSSGYGGTSRGGGGGIPRIGAGVGPVSSAAGGAPSRYHPYSSSSSSSYSSSSSSMGGDRRYRGAY